MEISINLEPCDFSFFFSSLFIVDERLAARLGTWLNLIEKRREFGLVNRVYRRGCKHDVTTCQLNQPKWCRRALKHWWTQRPWKLRISEAVYVLELIWFFFFFVFRCSLSLTHSLMSSSTQIIYDFMHIPYFACACNNNFKLPYTFLMHLGYCVCQKNKLTN